MSKVNMGLQITKKPEIDSDFKITNEYGIEIFRGKVKEIIGNLILMESNNKVRTCFTMIDYNLGELKFKEV